MSEENVEQQENIAQQEERENAEKFYPAEMQKEVDERGKAEPEAEEADTKEEVSSDNEDKAASDASDSDVKDKKESIDLKGLEIPNEDYISQEDVERIAKVAEEQGLSKDVAQMLINERAEALEGLANAFLSQSESTRAEWKESTLSDKEIGGDNIDKTVRRANSFLDKYATPELRELIEAEGFGNHPEVLRFLSRAGASMENDSSVIGGKAPVNNTRSIEDIFYPSMKE